MLLFKWGGDSILISKAFPGNLCFPGDELWKILTKKAKFASDSEF